MKAFKINVLHGTPKNSWINLYGFFLAENEEEVYEYIKELEFWDEDDESEIYTKYDDDYNEIGTETFKERIIRFKGRINEINEDESIPWEYGITAYGWEDLGEVTLLERNILKKFDLMLN
jgi:hypothetical protein